MSWINLMPWLGFSVRSNHSFVTEAVSALATSSWSFSEFTCGHFPHNSGGTSANLESWCLAETNRGQFWGWSCVVSQRIPKGISPTAYRSNPFTSAPDCYPFSVLPGYVCLVTRSCPTLCNPKDCNWQGSFVHVDSPGKNTGVGSHALLQWIFPTPGSNPGLPHCRQILYP